MTWSCDPGAELDERTHRTRWRGAFNIFWGSIRVSAQYKQAWYTIVCNTLHGNHRIIDQSWKRRWYVPPLCAVLLDKINSGCYTHRRGTPAVFNTSGPWRTAGDIKKIKKIGANPQEGWVLWAMVTPRDKHQLLLSSRFMEHGPLSIRNVWTQYSMEEKWEGGWW